MTGARPIRVLVVDDVVGLRELYKFILKRNEESEEFEVVGEAGDGAAAIDRAKALQPDVILLDVSMPIMDGLEALPHLLRVSPRSRIVVLTGFDASRLATTALALGATTYLEKGVPPERIVEETRRAAGLPSRDASGTATADEARAATGKSGDRLTS